MKTSPPLPDRLRVALTSPTRGVVGLVDDLLWACPEDGLRLDWQEGRCRVHPRSNGAAETIDVPLPRSVFRAMLARLAALCNEREPGSVSPYGGRGELSAGGEPESIFLLEFANRPGEQNLVVQPTTTRRA